MKAILLATAITAGLTSLAMAQTPAPNSQLCLSQLELLESGDKLTEEEKAVFVAQCECLEKQEQGGGDEQGTCAQD